MENKTKAFARLLTIMDELRVQCPWDKKQTMDSLRYLTIEELYELSDAILEKDMVDIKKELGDLLLHIVFYAKIGSETNDFDIADVINSVCDKLVHRHPHIYGDVKVANEEEVKANWEKLKLKEGNKSVLEGVPKSLPAIVKAFRIQEKVRGIGFDWEKMDKVLSKVDEEIDELKESIIENKGINEELGDVLFTLVNLSRHLDIDPELSLKRSTEKFMRRFKAIEDEVDIEKLSLEELDEIWNRNKEKDKLKK